MLSHSICFQDNQELENSTPIKSINLILGQFNPNHLCSTYYLIL